MSDFAIRAEALGKKYQIGRQAARHDSLRDAVTSALTAPLRNLRDIRRIGSATEDADTFWAFRDVSFELRHGDVLGVIGRNGAGKSTLLKVLSRITEPSAGRAKVRGRVGSLLEVGTGFHPDLTGRENLFLNGAILGMDRAYVERRFEEIVEFAGVAKFIDTPVKRYSSGMYLRLAFAVAAHLEPDILIVDEVLAVGDAQFQKKCLGKMSSVSKEGRTVLFVSHNLTAVRTLCTRAILLRQGRVVADASASDAVAQYVADVNQNLLEREYPDHASAPQNTSALIRRVAVRSERDAVSDQIDTATPLLVEIDYETKSDDAVVGFTLLVHDAENNAVFISISNRETRYYGRPMATGTYRTTCRIPANLLNAGWFTIGLNMFGSNFSDNRFTHEILRFEVQDSQEIRGDYFGPYWGAVRPALEWTTETRVPEPVSVG